MAQDHLQESLIDKKRRLFDQYAQYVTAERRAVLEKNSLERTRHVAVVLEDIYQPHNSSAVLRTADCFGVQDIHIIEQRNTFLLSKDIAKGAAQWLSLTKYSGQDENNTLRCFKSLKEQGYAVVATTPHRNDMLIQDLPIDKKVALVFGTEQSGLSVTALEQADLFVKVPLYGFTESFNISVCTGIVLYELIKRLRESSVDWHLSEGERVDLLLQWLAQSTTIGPLIYKELALK